VEHAAGAGALDPAMVEWLRDVSGATEVRVERRSAGASRAGYAVDAVRPDGSVRALWLRMDTGVGPQSGGYYTLRREAAVYRALLPTPVRVPVLVAVHPTEEAFLTERLEGRNWFSELTDPAEQEAIARELMVQLAELHRLVPGDLDVPELGPAGRVGAHVVEEIDRWDAQYRQHADEHPWPLAVLALTWLRERRPADGDWPTVLVQGDTGPGNFMFRDGRLVAVTDWEMAHWGDLHDDLGWICVRDLQERFTDLRDRFRDYELAGGRRVDLDRLRYFRVLAQMRCAIGPRNGLLARDSRSEIANHLIYSTLHARLLAEALAEADGVARPDAGPAAEPGPSEATWIYDVALDDLRTTVVPAIDDGFAARRAKGLARLLKYLRDLDRLGPAAREAERAEWCALLGPAAPAGGDLGAQRRAVCAAVEAGRLDHRAVLEACLRQEARTTGIVRSAMGALADRHFAPIDGPTGSSAPPDASEPKVSEP
jgi:aminoglycoside phosphotransferase (APT) family kinase protein